MTFPQVYLAMWERSNRKSEKCSLVEVFFLVYFIKYKHNAMLQQIKKNILQKEDRKIVEVYILNLSRIFQRRSPGTPIFTGEGWRLGKGWSPYAKFLL